MSTSRDSNFYDEIQDTLKKGLKAEGYEVPDESIKGALAALFDSVAIHTWRRADVYGVAWRAGWPISQTMADEILADVEAHADSEYGITWLTFENAVQEFYAELDWDHLDPLEDEQCMGSFLVCLEPPDYPGAAESMLHLERASFAEALEEADQLAENSGQTVACYSIPKEEPLLLDADWLEKHAHKLLDLQLEEERRSGL
ncbi:MAG: hypothetical protein HN855_07640 [Anaerolineae bacterium]|jgi:hypothetical protein|nr:hypothetical protein [Anaerolineae bacterium]MBT7325012.1 hypothetical protein [Anaerolineae bacterium]